MKYYIAGHKHCNSILPAALYSKNASFNDVKKQELTKSSYNEFILNFFYCC